ncbi:sensor histidine kinase [Jatrophihabitans lederbergiae]|uniref:Sensor-like histidine kinase SenX3 n=1 Tax=Jatrophihabitans lederbergiae TaxID=3075547 RepID=A0ABU2J4H7_9ACTN|nr:HAMP domain-containing sensor histidine kinase [Jatrophihabitans sp. DSM 44399]MDT0259891.1 HAMP domain-containing sensor histidine kinase [Jatrophihabitans sp. DSM 44399]
MQALHITETALLWGGFGAAIAWVVTWPLSRRSQPLALLSVSVVATAASIGALIGNTRAMFLTKGDEYVTVSVACLAGLMAAFAAIFMARRFTRDSEVIHAAVDALRAGQLPAQDGRQLSGELRRLRAELDSTAQTLTETRDRERALEASRRELVAWVSHDLRTPLAGLRAMAEALEDGIAESPDRYHKQMRIEVDRLAGMVDDLFEISRLQAGAPRARTDRVNLDDLVSDCVAALEPVAKLQRVQLVREASITGCDTQEVVGDSAELNRAITNLLINAIRHSAPDTTVAIGVSSAIGDSGPAVRVRVRDQCGGIAAHDLPRLFDVGYRGQQARTPSPDLGGRAGLGLAITRGIITAHLGIVAVNNTADGCEFTVQLPLPA